MKHLIVMLLLALFSHAAWSGQTVHVATNGSDATGDGSQANPWATITFALDSVSDGALILVQPGLYQGRIRIRGQFASPVTVESAQPYQAQLRHTGTVLTAFENASGIVIQGFDIAHTGPGAAALVIQIQDSNADQSVHSITLRDNIIHDSYNNDLLKINNGATDVEVLGNLFYNQSGSDEHIDANSVQRVRIEGNLFFNDFAASGRPNNNDTSGYIVVKDSNGSSDAFTGSSDIQIRRNLFLNWEGSPGSNFILCGEDGQPFHEAFDLLIENNLLLGNSDHAIRAPIGVKGCRDVMIRANTISGDLPGNAYAMRLNREGANPVNDNIAFHNNIFSDETGSMNDFSDTPLSDTINAVLSSNQYFNGGAVLPEGNLDLLNPSDDLESITADAGLLSPEGLVTPWWNATAGQFDGGFVRIDEAFESLALLYGSPSLFSPGIDQADPAHMPADDLLGLPRDLQPDIGAVESTSIQTIFADGFES